ncbi:DNA adenine methylase [Vibrio sinaloensis]|nr:DNA adenine methylase [Vibrio sinaloensis]
MINLYNLLKENPQEYILEAKRWFCPENNRKEAYLDIRSQFNATDDVMYRSLAFSVHEPFWFLTACVVTTKKGGFNVPFGSYKKPYFSRS